MDLTHITIEYETTGEDATIKSGGGVTIYNPSEYSIKHGASWKRMEAKGMELPQLQYSRGDSRSLSFKLVIDGYETGTDIRSITAQLSKLTIPFKKMKGVRPPGCTIKWGISGGKDVKFEYFKGVVTSLNQSFTLFLPNGTPVRATADLVFMEVKSIDDQLRATPASARRRLARQGDALWSIANDEYGDPALWRLIAEANGVVNPLRIQPGVQLLIPSLD